MTCFQVNSSSWTLVQGAQNYKLHQRVSKQNQSSWHIGLTMMVCRVGRVGIQRCSPRQISCFSVFLTPTLSFALLFSLVFLSQLRVFLVHTITSWPSIFRFIQTPSIFGSYKLRVYLGHFMICHIFYIKNIKLGIVRAIYLLVEACILG